MAAETVAVTGIKYSDDRGGTPVISGSVRRVGERVWRMRLPCAAYSAVARRNAVHTSLLFKWRVRFVDHAVSGGFAPVVVDRPVEASAAKTLARCGEVAVGAAPRSGRIETVPGCEVRAVVDATVYS